MVAFKNPLRRSKLKNTVYFSAETQSQNLGDWEINFQLMALVGPKAKVVVNTGSMPLDFLDYVLRGKERRISSRGAFFLSMMWSAIVGRFSGNSIFYFLNPGGFSGRGTMRGDVSHLFYVFVYALLSLVGVKIVRVGFSVDNLSPLRALAERTKARFMYFLGPRDAGSRMFFSAIPDSKCTYFPDLALQRVTSIAEDSTVERRIVAFSFRNHSATREPEPGIKRQIVAICQEAPTDCAFAFVSQVSFDQDFNGALARWLQEHLGRRVEHFIPSSMDELDEFYDRTLIVVSNRLHVLLFAISRGAVPLALTSGDLNAKVVGVMSDLGLEDNILDLDSPTKKIDAPALEKQLRSARKSALEKKRLGAVLIDRILWI
jgi:polysaccharide pyruvyl transferase WcaK-like protein